MPSYLSTDPNAGLNTASYLSTDPNAGDAKTKKTDDTGGFKSSAMQAIGQGIRGAGQAAADFIPGVSQDNALTRQGDEIIKDNQTAVHSLEDIAAQPLTAFKEATGNAVGSMASMVGAKALGEGIAMIPHPVAKLVGKGISYIGPSATAALPSYGGIRQQQIEGDLSRVNDTDAKLRALAGAAAVGAIETRFGPQEWALSAFTKEGRKKLAEKFAAKTLPGAIAKGGLLGGFVEGAEELVQNPIEQIAAYQDPTTKEAINDTIFSGAMGAIGGGLPGGVIGGANHAMRGRTAETQPFNAGEILGTVPNPAAPVTEGGGPTLQPITAATGTFAGGDAGLSSAKPTAAEEALAAIKPITALDRVATLDAEGDALLQRQRELSQPEYGPMFDGERAEVESKLSGLMAERESITKTWPKATEGAETNFTTEAGARLNARYALMEVGDLTSSHDENLRASLTYPAEMQPRQRDRAASEMQISGIVQKLDPARLGESPDAATGAPIVGADGLVESGNARTIALKRVYQANGAKADAYRQYLKDNAARFGLTPEQVDGMQRPVLVRVRTTPVDRAEFARQANASTVAQMSPSEQARADAARIDSLEDLNPDEAGDFTSGTSRGFVRRFMASLPGTEQAGMIDASGQLSQSGYIRMRNAILAKAYGDSPVLLRMVESLDNNLRGISNALMRAAPAVAKSRQAIAEGAMFDADITPDLMAAVEELSRLKDDGRSVADALAQSGMFGEQYSPETRELLQYLAENIRKPRKIADFIQAYFEALAAAGHPAQTSLLGDTRAPGKGELLTAARGESDVQDDPDGGTNLSRRQEPGAQDRRQPGDETRDQGGAQGDEAEAGLKKPDVFANLPDRKAGETDIEYAKRAIDDIDVGPIPDRPGDYFNSTENMVPVKDLVKSRPDDVGNGQHARARMLAVARGILSRKRGPLLVQRLSGGKYKIINGNSTYDAAVESGMKALPVRVASMKEQFDHLRLIFGGDPPPKDKPVVLVFGGTFNPISTAHAQVALSSRDMLERYGYTVEKIVVTPSPSKLIWSKAGSTAVGLQDRAAMARLAFGKDRGVRVETEPSAMAARMKQAPKRTFVADWVAEKYPNATVVSLAGEDTAPGKPPGFPSLYEHAGRYSLVLPREEDSPDAISSSRIRKAFDAGEVPTSMIHPDVAAYYQKILDRRKANKTIVVDGEEYDLDAKDFGFKKGRETLPADSPLLVDTINKPGREGLRQSIIDGHFSGISPAPAGSKPILYMFGGGGAAGKGTLKQKLSDDGKIPPRGQAVYLDPDDIKTGMIPEYKEIEAAGDWRAANVTHEESSMLTKAVSARAMEGKYDLVLDITMAKAGPSLATIKRFQDAGYEVRLYGVVINPQWAVIRALRRADETGRHVPIDHLLVAHKGFSKAVRQYAEAVDSARIYDATTNKENVLVAEKNPGDRSASWYNEIELGEINEQATTLREILPEVGSERANQRGWNEAGREPVRGRHHRGEQEAVRGDQEGAPARIGDGRETPGYVGGQDVNRETGTTGTQGQVSDAVPPAGGEKGTGRVRDDQGGGNRLGNSVDDAGTAPQGEVGQTRAGGVRGTDTGERRAEPGDRAGRDAGVPDGRLTQDPDEKLREGMAELGAVLRQYYAKVGGVRMLTPEESAKLMPALIKILEALYEKGTKAAKALIAQAQAKLKKHDDEFVRTHWNKITPADYAAAAQQAIENIENRDQQGDLFTAAAKPPKQGGFDFNQPAKGPDDAKQVQGQETPEKVTPAKPPRKAPPAGRDIPPKTGRNFVFGDNDLTYEGSWAKKAEQNVEAVELLKKLEADSRQATREEQAVLAKFIGWGASEIANTLFGDKLNKDARLMDFYQNAIANMESLGRDVLRPSKRLGSYRGASFQSADPAYYDALNLIRTLYPAWQYDRDITRADLDKARPAPATRKWLELRDRLQAVMTDQEWAEASRSTQYAHYTSKPVVKAMWRGMERMGFKGGYVLEPGAGIGVFPGLMPQAMAHNSSYTGIEFDSITGGILKQLFPDERILVESFVDTQLPPNFFTVAAGNPPFGQTPILADPKYRKLGFALHDYFFAKTIDSVQPGGLVMFVSSRYTMDKLNDKARAWMSERADLVGAIRLPQTAFQKNAGTEVVTDVLFLRKKVPGETFEHGQSWAKSVPIVVNGTQYNINEYFAAHPEMVLGKHSDAGSMYGDKEYTVEPLDGDIEAQFDKAVDNLPEDILRVERGSAAEAAAVREIDFNPKAQKEGNYYVSDAGVLMQRENGVGVRVEKKSEKDIALLKDFVGLRDALKQAHYDQLNDGDWEKSLAALQKAYRAFVAKHGRINQFKFNVRKVEAVDEETGETYQDEIRTKRLPLLEKLYDDPEYSRVMGLEDINDDTGEITESQFLTDRVLGKPAKPEIRTTQDALLSVLNDVGKVDLAMIAGRLGGMDEADVVNALGTAIYQDPSEGWVMADEYLSGNVKEKLDQAIAAARSDRRYERNVEALREVQPTPKTSADIVPQLGMFWIPPTIYEQFLKEKTGVKAKVTYNKAARMWTVEAIEGRFGTQSTVDWGTPHRAAHEILDHAMNGNPVQITTKDPVNGGTVVLKDAMEAANQKIEQMKQAFSDWLWTDATRANELVKLYNDKFNTIAPRKFDGKHLDLPGASDAWRKKVHQHVKRGVWRIIQSGNTYLAHAVGSGKTAQMVMSAMEQKRLGLIKKPMIVVPNHMLQQMNKEWLEIYPAAKLMVADEKNFHTENRRRWASRVALSDVDGVIITHSAFKLLDIDPEFQKVLINRELEYLRAAYVDAGGDLNKLQVTVELDKKGKDKIKVKGSGQKSPTIKQLERLIEAMEQRLRAAMSSEGKDTNVRFDELGVDMLYVDEAHEYRKLQFATKRSVYGIDPVGSQQAYDLWIKTRWLKEKNPKRYLVMASGTPVTNTMAELYSVQKMMDYDTLEAMGLEDFDSWAAQFGTESTSLEQTASGGYAPVTRFNKFVNVNELTQMFRQFADVLTSDHLAAMLGDKRPKAVGGGRQMTLSPKLDLYTAFLKQELEPRMVATKNWKKTPEQDYNPDPVVNIMTDAKLAAIDMRFMEKTLPSDPDSKLNRMIDGVIRVYKETGDIEYNGNDGKPETIKGAAQMVFFEQGFGKGITQTRGFDARAWFQKRMLDAGIPPDHVAFMSDYKKSDDKLKLFKDVNAGRVRILVGSSKNMGTGVNAQQRLIAMHHLDAPLIPALLEQREGRILRQGNKNKNVQIYAHAMKGSYDEQGWAILARKQFFIDQALSGDANLREIEDVSEVSHLQQASAMLADDPRLMEAAGLKADIEKLERLYRAHEESRARMYQTYNLAGELIRTSEPRLAEVEKQAARVQDLAGDKFKAKADGQTFDKRKEWGEAIIRQARALVAKFQEGKVEIGSISGFPVVFRGEVRRSDLAGVEYRMSITLQDVPEGAVPLAYDVGESVDPVGLSMRATNALADVARAPEKMRNAINEARSRQDALAGRLDAPFQFAQTLADKRTELMNLEEAIKTTAGSQQTWTLTNTATGETVKGVAAENERAAKLKMIPWKKYSDAALDQWQATPEMPTEATPMLSRGAAGPGISLDTLTAVRDRVAARMKNLPPVHVFASPDSPGVPGELRAFIYKQGAQNDVEGALHQGEIYLFASGLRDALRAEQVLAEHEVTHYGLLGLLGKEGKRRVLQSIWARNARIRKQATAKSKANRINYLDATEEILADMDAKELASLSGWRGLVLALRNWFASHGFDNIARWMNAALEGTLSDQARADLFAADLVRRARAFVEKGPSVSGRYGGAAWVVRTSTQIKSATDNTGAFDSGNPDIRLSRSPDAAQRADAIIADSTAKWRPLDAITKAGVKLVHFDRATKAIYARAGKLLDALTPEKVKAGMVADYGIPGAVLDQRAMMQGRKRVQLRKTEQLIDKLAGLTRAESRVAYEWMNNDNPQAADYLEKQLPPESVAVLKDVREMIDSLSQEAVRLGQLSAETYKKHRYAYLRRSYAKHMEEMPGREKAKRQRAIAILGDQYKGRGMVLDVAMKSIQNVAPEWWQRKLQAGKADKGLKDEKFIRLERRAPSGEGTTPMSGIGDRSPGRLLEVAYWPAGESIPTKFKDWDRNGTWQVRDTKGDKLVLWRDFTKQERETMGEVDEARFAIARTLHGMIQDIETGRYLNLLAENHAVIDPARVTGPVVEASERMRDTFAPEEWVQVPDTKIPGTQVMKYGKLAGRYLPGPIWNDVRQTVGFRFQPLGETYAAIHSAWKTSKTALSPAVHMNNVMANFVMADWHDVGAGHILKSLRILLAASERDGKGIIGRTGNAAARAGMADREAAREILNRYQDSGGGIGTWITQEIQKEQLLPLIEALEKELGLTGQTTASQIGVMAAVQHLLRLRFPEALEAFKGSMPGKPIVQEARNLIGMYEAEDQVFRLAAWIKAKEDGINDLEAGKVARKSFLDYHINAPWVQMMRNTAFPFVAFTYRSVPMLLDVAAHKPWKLMKLGLVVGALNAIGYALSGGDEDDERKLLPEEKSGSIWGIVPKLVRMPWNDEHGSPVFLDIRRFVPVGDIFDVGQPNTAVPVPPAMVPSGPLALLGELALNKSAFTGKPVTQETDTGTEMAGKVFDHLYKALAPNVAFLPGTYAWTSVTNAGSGKTDAFGREQSVAQALASSVGVKLGSYPKDVLQYNAQRAAMAKTMEIDANIAKLRREFARQGITEAEFQEQAQAQMEKKRKVMEELGVKVQ